MTPRAKNVIAMDNKVLRVEFDDGTVKQCDMYALLKDHPVFSPLWEDDELFRQAYADVGGHGIIWNEYIDLEAEDVWYGGVVVEKKAVGEPAFYKIKKVVPLDDFVLQVRFENDIIKMCDIKVIAAEHPEVDVLLENEALFAEVSVVCGGCGIEFDEELDIECTVLWEHGVEMQSPFDEFIAFTDAVKIWRLNESTLRKAVANKKLIENIDAKKFGSQWVVTKTAMLREYGYPTVE